MTTSVATADRVDPALRRLIWILIVGAVAPALDTTVVNVALASLGRELHASVAASQWTVTGYLLAMAMAMPVAGWATERFGGKQMWVLSLVLFLVGSVLSALAWNIGSLIVFRVVQGVAAGLMMPVLTTLGVQAAGPRRLGGAMAVAMLPIVVVPIFGPVIGGLIVNDVGWRWIFYLNVPLCLVAVLLAWRGMPRTGSTGDRPRFDGLGLALLSPGLALIIYGLSEVAAGRGFGRAGVLLPMAAGGALTGAFVIHGLRRRTRPLINLRVLRVRSYAASVAVLFLAGLSVYGPLLLLALYYQQVQGRTALATGLLLAPQGVGSLLPRGIAGTLTDRIGPRPVVLCGLTLTGLGTLAFTQAGPATSGWLLAGSLFIRGAGLAPVTIAIMAGAFRDVPHDEIPDASSSSRVVQQIGGSFGAAVLAVILAHETLVHGAATAAARGLAFNTAFWWSIVFVVLAFVPALLLPTGAATESTPDRSSADARHIGGRWRT